MTTTLWCRVQTIATSSEEQIKCRRQSLPCGQRFHLAPSLSQPKQQRREVWLETWVQNTTRLDPEHQHGQWCQEVLVSPRHLINLGQESTCNLAHSTVPIRSYQCQGGYVSLLRAGLVQRIKWVRWRTTRAPMTTTLWCRGPNNSHKFGRADQVSAPKFTMRAKVSFGSQFKSAKAAEEGGMAGDMSSKYNEIRPRAPAWSMMPRSSGITKTPDQPGPGEYLQPSTLYGSHPQLPVPGRICKSTQSRTGPTDQVGEMKNNPSPHDYNTVMSGPNNSHKFGRADQVSAPKFTMRAKVSFGSQFKSAKAAEEGGMAGDMSSKYNEIRPRAPAWSMMPRSSGITKTPDQPGPGEYLQPSTLYGSHPQLPVPGRICKSTQSRTGPTDQVGEMKNNPSPQDYYTWGKRVECEGWENHHQAVFCSYFLVESFHVILLRWLGHPADATQEVVQKSWVGTRRWHCYQGEMCKIHFCRSQETCLRLETDYDDLWNSFGWDFSWIPKQRVPGPVWQRQFEPNWCRYWCMGLSPGCYHLISKTNQRGFLWFSWEWWLNNISSLCWSLAQLQAVWIGPRSPPLQKKNTDKHVLRSEVWLGEVTLLKSHVERSWSSLRSECIICPAGFLALVRLELGETSQISRFPKGKVLSSRFTLSVLFGLKTR